MNKKKKILAFVQARQTSKRLPNKIFLKFNNFSVIENIYHRLKKSKLIKNIIFTIPSNLNNNELKKHLLQKKYVFFCGPEQNVLKRFYLASKKFCPDIIIRITADCPLVDYRLIDKMVKIFSKSKKIDYLSNTINRTFPDGLDIEIFTNKALMNTYKMAKKKYDLEHVTPYMKRKLNVFNYQNKKDYSELRWTLDTTKDYNKLKKMFQKNKINSNTSWEKVLNYENS